MKLKLFLLLFLLTTTSTIFGQSHCDVFPSNPGDKILCYFHDTINNQLYVGGDFTAIYLGTQPPVNRSNVAKIDLFTNTVANWNPLITGGPVHCIQKVGNRIFIGGSFNYVNVDSSYSLVSVDANTAATVNTFTLGHGYSIRTSNNTDVDTVYSMDYDNGRLALGGIITKFNSTTITTPVIILNAPLNNNSYSINQINSIKGYTGTGVLNNSVETTKIKFYKKNGITCLLTATRGNYSFSISCFRYIHSINLSSNTYDLLCSDLFTSDFDIRADTLVILRRGFTSSNNVTSSLITPSTSIVNGFAYGIKLNGTPGYFPLTFSGYPFFGPLPNSCYNTNDRQSTVSFFENKYFIGNAISTTSCTTAMDYLQAYSRTGTPIPLLSIPDTILPDMAWSYPYIFYEIEKQGDKVIYLRGTQGFPGPLYLQTVCLLPKPLTPVTEINNTSTFCQGNAYKFVEATKENVYIYNWSYTGSGATISNNGNDTITISFAANATSGNLIVTAANSCGVSSNTVSKTINVQPIPSISAPATASINCYNNKQASLIVTTGVSTPVTYMWATTTNSFITSAITATTQGTYTAYVIDNISGCKNSAITQVLVDTNKAVISFISPSYTTNCSVPTLTLTAYSCLFTNCDDSLYWVSGSSNYPNPIIYSPSGAVNYLVVKNKYIPSGCINSFTTTIYNNDTIPSYTLNSPITYPSVGLPQFQPITCYNDSTFLSAASKPSVKLKWKRPGNDTLINPCYGNLPGVYQLLLLDTLNGCSNNSLFSQIISNKALPSLSINANLAHLNCSYSTATLVANSSSPGTTVIWYSPITSFTSASPATVNQQGLYYALATDTINGCAKKDSLNLLQSNTLILNKNNDSTICIGGSITLTASAIGGTAPFTYTWSNGGGNLNSATFGNNLTSNKYIVIIKDNLGCVGKDTIKITVPKVISDSTVTFKNCDQFNPAGQIQVYTKGGIPPYRYSINNGLTFQNTNSFTNLAFGTYSIIIKDTLGCFISTTATISHNSFSPKVDFITNTTIMQADTFVIVDISNPRPDSIAWRFPPGTQTINNSNPFSPVIICSDTGSFYVKAIAYFGACVDSLNKLVHFIKYDSTANKNEPYRGIKTFSLYPNPNTGQFNVVLEFYKKQAFVIKINTATGAEVFQAPAQYGDTAIVPISMPINTPGNYFIKVIAEFDAKQKGFIITN